MLDIGATVVEPDREEDQDEPLLRLSSIRQLTPKSTAGVALARVVSDAAQDVLLTAESDPRLAPPGPGATRGDVFIDDRLDVFYTLAGRYTTTTVSLFTRELDYRVTSLDEENRGYTIDVQRQFSRRVTASIFGISQRMEFLDVVPTQVDRYQGYGVRFSYRLGRRTTMSLEGQWNKQASTDTTVEYREKRATFQITYTKGGS